MSASAQETTQEPPLREVVALLRVRSSTLSSLDDAIEKCLRRIEQQLRQQRPGRHPVDVSFPPWGKLGWSIRRGRRGRLVVVNEDHCVDLLAMPRECRAAACLALPGLVDRIMLEPGGSQR